MNYSLQGLHIGILSILTLFTSSQKAVYDPPYLFEHQRKNHHDNNFDYYSSIPVYDHYNELSDHFQDSITANSRQAMHDLFIYPKYKMNLNSEFLKKIKNLLVPQLYDGTSASSHKKSEFSYNFKSYLEYLLMTLLGKEFKKTGGNSNAEEIVQIIYYLNVLKVLDLKGSLKISKEINIGGEEDDGLLSRGYVKKRLAKNMKERKNLLGILKLTSVNDEDDKGKDDKIIIEKELNDEKKTNDLIESKDK